MLEPQLEHHHFGIQLSFYSSMEIHVQNTRFLFIVGPFCVFLLGPLASVTMDVFPLANFPFITANFVSSIHVILSLASFRFLLSPKLSRRRIGAAFFFLRQYFDELDGKVAYFWMDRHMHTPG